MELDQHAHHQHGFSMIELMITVAIIGILSSIAIPSYTIFVSRAEVIEGINLANAAKTAVAETFNHTGTVPDQLTTGYVGPSTEIVSGITIADDGLGTITINFTPKVFGIVVQLHPRLNVGQAITWDCQTIDSSDNIYVPSECRL